MLGDLSFLESVEKAHAALDTNARVAACLGVRMDSQAKYAALARGGGDGGVYLWLLVAGGGYEEKIWVRLVCFFFFCWGGPVWFSLPMIMVTMFATFFMPCAHIPPASQDHAPGSLLVEEAGGIISDSRGRPLDFGRGHTLGEHFGVVAARKEVARDPR